MSGAPAAWSRDLLEASPDAVLVVGKEGLIEMASPAVEQLFGYRPSELVGQPIELLVPEELVKAHRVYRDSYGEAPEPRAMGSGLDLRGRRRDGTTFPVDVSLAPVLLEGTLRSGAFVRDATDRRRNEDLLRAVNEISRRLLSDPDTGPSLRLAAERARTLSEAAAAWVVVPKSSGGLVVAAAGGIASGKLEDSELSEESLSGRVMASGETRIVTDMASEPAVLAEARGLGLGPGLYLPMRDQHGPVGALVVARLAAEGPFGPGEVRAMELFASAVAVVVSLGTARNELDQLRTVSEHERIARDLHDTVIQRLFALGMSLQALQLMAAGTVAERLEVAVDSIDQVIREIRETIFELHKPLTGGPAVRERLREVAAEVTEHLGFAPRLAFRGPVEAAMSEELLPELLAVAREALSNVARHAGAHGVEVVLTAKDGLVILTVADDGRGIADSPSAGNGLTNMRERAERLRGELLFTRRDPHGTVLEWRVPTPSS